MGTAIGASNGTYSTIRRSGSTAALWSPCLVLPTRRVTAVGFQDRDRHIRFEVLHMVKVTHGDPYA